MLACAMNHALMDLTGLDQCAGKFARMVTMSVEHFVSTHQMDALEQ